MLVFFNLTPKFCCAKEKKRNYKRNTGMDQTKTPYEFDNNDIIFIVLSYYYMQYTFFNYPKVKICEFLGYNLRVKTSANEICGCISKKQLDFLLFVFTYGEKYADNKHVPKNEQIEFQCCIGSGFSESEPKTKLFEYKDMNDDHRIVDIFHENKFFRKYLSNDFYKKFVRKMIASGTTMNIAIMNIFCIYLHINKNNNSREIYKLFEVIRSKDRNIGEVKKYKQYLYKACFLYYDNLSRGNYKKIDSYYVINCIDKYISKIEARCHDEREMYSTFNESYKI